MSFLTDEHVPSVFVTTLRSHGYTVIRANDEFEEGTPDGDLLEFCDSNDHILITHDKKDFAGETGQSQPHNGIVIYTDANTLRDQPEKSVQILERILSQYPPTELENELVWLDQWRDRE